MDSVNYGDYGICLFGGRNAFRENVSLFRIILDNENDGCIFPFHSIAMAHESEHKLYDDTIAQGGFRLTRQRREVYEALMEHRDHPTAVEVFMRVKPRMPSISLATVYNCLDTLTQCGLVRQVNVDRAPSRFCPNLEQHAHFFCEQCGGVTDVDLPHPEEVARVWKLPEHCVVTHHDVTLRGICPACAANPDLKPKKNHHSHEIIKH